MAGIKLPPAGPPRRPSQRGGHFCAPPKPVRVRRACVCGGGRRARFEGLIRRANAGIPHAGAERRARQLPSPFDQQRSAFKWHCDRDLNNNGSRSSDLVARAGGAPSVHHQAAQEVGHVVRPRRRVETQAPSAASARCRPRHACALTQPSINTRCREPRRVIEGLAYHRALFLPPVLPSARAMDGRLWRARTHACAVVIDGNGAPSVPSLYSRSSSTHKKIESIPTYS